MFIKNSYKATVTNNQIQKQVKNTNRHFAKADMWMAKKHVKKNPQHPLQSPGKGMRKFTV